MTYFVALLFSALMFSPFEDNKTYRTYPFGIKLNSEKNGWFYGREGYIPLGSIEFQLVSIEIVTSAQTPTVTDDFGGEYTYLRGAAASPLSVSATVTDGGKHFKVDKNNARRECTAYAP